MDTKKLVLIVSLLFLGKFVFSRGSYEEDTILCTYKVQYFNNNKPISEDTYDIKFFAPVKEKDGKRSGAFNYWVSDKTYKYFVDVLPFSGRSILIHDWGFEYRVACTNEYVHLYDSLEKKKWIARSGSFWGDSLQYEKSVPKEFLNKYTVTYNKLTITVILDLNDILKWFTDNAYIDPKSIKVNKYYCHLKWVKEIGLVGFDEYYDGKLIRKTELTHITYPENDIKQAVGDMKEENLELMKQMKYYYMK